MHEDPYIIAATDRSGGRHRFTVEPGLYDISRFGVRIEDDVVVTETGADCLTAAPREIRVVG